MKQDSDYGRCTEMKISGCKVIVTVSEHGVGLGLGVEVGGGGGWDVGFLSSQACHPASYSH